MFHNVQDFSAIVGFWWVESFTRVVFGSSPIPTFELPKWPLSKGHSWVADAKWACLKMRLTSSYGSLIENIDIDILVQIQGFQNMRQPQACIKSSHDDCGSKIQDMFARHCKMQCFIIFAIFQKKHSAVNLLINRFLGHVFFPHTSQMIKNCKWSMVYWADHVRIQELLCLVACQTLTGHSLKPDFWF